MLVQIGCNLFSRSQLVGFLRNRGALLISHFFIQNLTPIGTQPILRVQSADVDANFYSGGYLQGNLGPVASQ